MNCILFNSPLPFRLEKNDPRLEHIRKYLRTPEGGEVYAGKVGEFMCVTKIQYLPNGGAQLNFSRPIKNPDKLNLTFCAAFTRPQIAQRILFECACFGVNNIVFYAANKSESAYLKSGLYSGGEYAEFLIKGAQQACSCSIPEFRIAENLKECISLAETLEPKNMETLRIAPDVYEAELHLKDAVAKCPADSVYKTIIIGGERGFDNSERDLLRLNRYRLVSLSSRVLRTDTAAIAALSTFAQ